MSYVLLNAALVSLQLTRVIDLDLLVHIVRQVSIFFFNSRESDTSNWYVVLKAPPRSFDELEMFDESTYMSSTPLDLSRLDLSVDDEDECYVRIGCEGMLVKP